MFPLDLLTLIYQFKTNTLTSDQGSVGLSSEVIVNLASTKPSGSIDQKIINTDKKETAFLVNPFDWVNKENNWMK